MSLRRENGPIDGPKITEGVAMLICFGNGLPEAETGCFTPVPYDKCHDLPRSTTHCRPYPTGLLPFLDKAPDFVQFEHIIWCCRQKRFWNLR
jgi:hypothetical protein